jgi:hypothetical protein
VTNVTLNSDQEKALADIMAATRPTRALILVGA